MPKNITDTYLFKEYDKSIKLTNTILKLTTTGEVLTEDDLKENISEIERRYYFTSKNTVITDFKTGRIRLLYNPGVRFPNTMPAFLINTGKHINCIVNVSNVMHKNKEGFYNVETRTLFNLMQSGSILVKCYTDKGISSKSQLIKLGSSMYSKLFAKILNKMYSINISPERQDIIIYMSSLFFIRNLLGRTSDGLKELNKKYALENCKTSSRLIVNDALYKFNDDDFKSLDTFIKALARNVSGLEDLTTRAFVDNYILSYGPTMIFSLEYLPIFLYNIFSVVVGAFINNQNALETTLGREIDQLYNFFFTN